MDSYLARIARLPVLSADRERLLAFRAKTGDSVAREELITSHLGLVVARARHLGLSGQRLLDAVQAGSEGLINAVDRFDPERGSRLSSYAWWWIIDAMKYASREVASGDVLVLVEPVETDRYATLHAVLEGLDGDEAAVLRLRYGWGGPDAVAHSRKATSERLGLSPARVRRLEGKAIEHIRRRLAKVGDRAPHERSLGGAGPL